MAHNARPVAAKPFAVSANARESKHEPGSSCGRRKDHRRRAKQEMIDICDLRCKQSCFMADGSGRERPVTVEERGTRVLP